MFDAEVEAAAEQVAGELHHWADESEEGPEPKASVAKCVGAPGDPKGGTMSIIETFNAKAKAEARERKAQARLRELGERWRQRAYIVFQQIEARLPDGMGLLCFNPTENSLAVKLGKRGEVRGEWCQPIVPVDDIRVLARELGIDTEGFSAYPVDVLLNHSRKGCYSNVVIEGIESLDEIEALKEWARTDWVARSATDHWLEKREKQLLRGETIGAKKAS